MKVELQNLTKVFPSRHVKGEEVVAVNNFTFTIPDGKLVGLLGPSGCGKSTTLYMICGLQKPSGGKIFFGDDDVTLLPPENRGVGLVFQNYALYPHMTVKQNIMFPLQNLKGADKLTKEQMLERAYECAKIVQIDELMDRKPSELSGGQQQRVALARILLTKPEILLLDEPLSALDSYLRWQTELEIQEVLEDFPGTTLLVTHSREEVHRLCRTVTVLDHGAGEGSMPVQTLFHAPETLSACLLSGCKNYSRAERLDEKHVRALDWGVTLACGARPDTRYVAIRAHHIALSDTPGENTIPCGVLRVVDDVFSTIVMASTPGGDTAQSRLRVELPKEAWSDRETLYLHLAPEHLMTLK